MDLLATSVFTIILLACALGSLLLFYRAIRAMMAKRIWSGFKTILASILLGFIVSSAIYNPGHKAGKMALRTWCNYALMNNILIMRMYAGDHDGKYPATLNDMVGDYLKAGDLKILICPSSEHQVGSGTNIHSWTDYAYVSGLTEADPTNCVMIFCLPENHKGDGVNIGFISGLAQWYSCKPYKDSTGQRQPTFHELTNTPSLFYGTTNEVELAELMKRTRIIYPKRDK